MSDDPRTELPENPKPGQRVTLDHGDGVQWRWKYNARREKWELLEVVAPQPAPVED